MSTIGADPVDRLRDALADRYTLQRELGRGGMATVHLAQDLKHQRPVALKVLHPELAAALGSERFLREITTTAALDHPHILPLLDSGEAAGSLFYTMPYVEGESLRDRLARERQLPLEDALQIAREVADALGYAHSRGVIHRDIKPENILLAGGHARVADFGIATAVAAGGGAKLTQTGFAVGTPAYMSPEQASADPQLDGRSDLYALGCVLYEMLSGEVPYLGTTPQGIFAKKLAEPAPRVSVMRETVPEGIEAALLKVLARSPADRYATAAQFAEALQRGATNPASTAARPAEAWRTHRQLARRAAMLVAGVIVLVAAAFGFARIRAATEWKRAALDSNVVAVTPFRVSAADPLVGSLGEGILDLLYPVLTGEVAPRMVEIGSLQRAWADMQRRGDAAALDAPLRLAARFGAGLLLEGGIAQAGDHVTVNGALTRVPDGQVIATYTVSAPVDSIAVLPARLVAGLLGARLSEGRERLAVLERYPQEAVLAYLAGARAYRNADLATAMREFERALAIDSTFALAALRGAQVPQIPGEWNPDRPDEPYRRRGKLLTLAATYRSTFAPRDQAVLRYLLVRRGQPYLASRIRTAARAWAETVPDDPEAWLELAALQDQTPAPDMRDDARRSLERAWALDSATAQLVERHLVEAITRGDRDLVTRVGARYLQVADTATPYYASQAWDIALLNGDSAAVRRWRDRADRGDPRVITPDVWLDLNWTANHLSLPFAEADLVWDRLFAQARTRSDSAKLVTPPFATNYGQFRLGLSRRTPQLLLLSWALIYPQLDSAAHQLLERERRGLAKRARFGPDLDGPELECTFALYRVAHGDTAGVRATVHRLEPEYRLHGLAGVCPAAVDALLEAQQPRGQVAPALERLDSIVRLGPWTEFPIPFALVAIPRLLRQRGEYARALAAARWSWPNTEVGAQAAAALLREEGDLFLILGDTTSAIAAYDRFLRRWHRADDLGRLWTDSVRAVIAALTAKSGERRSSSRL